MSVFTFVVVIVAIVASVIMALIKHRYRHNSGADSAKVNALESEIQELKERVATLEKIVTDSSYDLKKQFRDLEKERMA